MIAVEICGMYGSIPRRLVCCHKPLSFCYRMLQASNKTLNKVISGVHAKRNRK